MGKRISSNRMNGSEPEPGEKNSESMGCVVIVVVAPPVHQEPPPAPEPQKIWVPPVMGTRTEPGYWDYGIRKVWMGDHWRFEQDLNQRRWMPEKKIEVVKQEGYWKLVE